MRETDSLTARTLYNRQQANFGACYVVAQAYSLEQQNRRALPYSAFCSFGLYKKIKFILAYIFRNRSDILVK